MRLVINAQDIRAITFGLVKDTRLDRERTVFTKPEGYLAALDQTLTLWQIIPAALTGVVVVTGPGSFTASRVSTTIANALAFSQNMPIVGLENAKHLPLKDLVHEIPQSGSTYVLPSYDRPPEITMRENGRGDNKAD